MIWLLSYIPLDKVALCTNIGMYHEHKPHVREQVFRNMASDRLQHVLLSN